MITDVLLFLLLLKMVVSIATLSRQIEAEHRELMQTIDALAEMIGEAIDQNERS